MVNLFAASLKHRKHCKDCLPCMSTLHCRQCNNQLAVKITGSHNTSQKFTLSSGAGSSSASFTAFSLLASALSSSPGSFPEPTVFSASTIASSVSLHKKYYKSYLRWLLQSHPVGIMMQESERIISHSAISSAGVPQFP